MLIPRESGNAIRPFSALSPLPELVRELNAFRPTSLIGYPTLIRLLAQERAAGRLTIEPETPVMPPFPHHVTPGVTSPLTHSERRAGENQTPQVARVLRAVTEDSGEREEKS